VKEDGADDSARNRPELAAMRVDEAFAELAHRIDPGGRMIRTWELAGGVSAQVTGFEIESGEGSRERLVLRRHGARDLAANPHGAADEFRLLGVLASAGIPVPAPRYLDGTGELFSTPCLVVEFVDGATPTTADEQAVAAQLAAILAAIHQIDASTAAISFLPDRRLEDPGRPRNSPVLLHGDFWPGNTLWKDGRLVAVIDWEDAAIGDPLADVANARLELLWAYGADAMNDFTDTYAKQASDLDLAALPDWDLRADRRLTPRLAEWGLDAATERAMRKRSEAFVAQARGALSAS
jgi:aminoglycoside phosphotransferase (APT) family kinase protein